MSTYGPFGGDDELAGDIAARAGGLLLAIRSGWSWSGTVPDRDLGRRGDREANELILSVLAEQRPGDAVLSEESADMPTRLTADRVWIIDPLDGTREFSMPGRADWAVHVALWERGQEISAAAVAQPALGSTYVSGVAPAGGRGGAAYEAPLSDVMLVSDSRPPAFAGAVAERAGLRIAQMGSAGAKAMAVVRGDAAAYLHAGGQWEWDSAAPVGVALSVGLHASRLDGSPLLYNQQRPYLPDLVICRPELAAPILEAVGELAGDG